MVNLLKDQGVNRFVNPNKGILSMSSEGSSSNPLSMLNRFPRVDSEPSAKQTAPDSSAERLGETPIMDPAQNEKRGKLATFEPRLPRYRFEDLVLPRKVFEDLSVLESMIKNHAIVYETWGMGKIDPYGQQVAFNLFGPPGTGKTMIVEALASKWDKLLIDVNMAQLESKYVGETGKNIEAAFLAAREQDAILLFDEADAVLGRRLSEVRQSADSSVNTARGVMLKQLEQHSGIVAFATNFAHNYDTAFTRRILKHIRVPLPDFASRKELFMRKIPAGAPGYGALDWDRFATESELFAGGDILVIVKNALFDAIRRPEQTLTTDIVMDAIRDWRVAKDNIGQWGESTVEVIRKQPADTSNGVTDKEVSK